MKSSRISIFIKAMVFAAIFVLLVNAFAFTSFIVPVDNGNNTLSKEDRVLVNKWSYGLRLPFTEARLLEERPQKGDVVIFNNPNPSGKGLPVYRRGLLIDRCIGLPGDTLLLSDELIILNDNSRCPDKRSLYLYPQSKEELIVEAMKSVGISHNFLAGYKDSCFIRSFSYHECYLLKRKLKTFFCLTPLYKGNEDSHPFIVPSKGKRIKITPWNMTLMCNTILNHENRVAAIIKGELWVDGTPVKSYRFTQDYYWMVSENPMNLNDSRMFGFVPQSHLIGKAWFVWFSSHRDHLLQRIE